MPNLDGMLKIFKKLSPFRPVPFMPRWAVAF